MEGVELVKLLDLHLGRPVTRGPLSLFPVWNGAAVIRRGYDLGTAAVTVSERTGSPVVAELVATNAGERPALVLEGELLEGGQQHRVAARSVLVPAGASHALDVRCVEQGRWSGTMHHARGGRRATTGVRATRDQGGTWEQVRRLEQAYGAGDTSSLLEVTGRVHGDAARLVAGLRPLPFTSGLLVGVGGQPLLLEVYDSPRTLAETWDGLVQAAAVDALGAPAVPTPGRRARRFVDRLTAVQLAGAEAGEGTSVAGASPYAVVSGLLWRDRAVHTAVVNPRHQLVAA